MKTLTLLALLLLSLSSAAGTLDLPKSIFVFTTHDEKPLFVTESKRNGIRLKLYYMDTLKHLEVQLSKGLPSTQDKAEKIASRRIEKFTDEIEKRVARLSEGVSLYQFYGLEKYPAAVVNECHTVYGTADLREVARLWRKAGSCK